MFIYSYGPDMNQAIIIKRISMNSLWSFDISATKKSRQNSKENSCDAEITDQALLAENPVLLSGPSCSFRESTESRRNSKENSSDEEITDQALLAENPVLLSGPSCSIWESTESRQNSKENSCDAEITDQALLAENPVLLSGPSCSFRESTERRESGTNNILDVIHSPHDADEHLLEGSLIWAKLAKKDFFWPAIVLNAKTAGFNSCNEDQCCVFWIRDHRVSKVPKKNILPFTEHIPYVYKLKNNLRALAIYESIDLFFQRSFCVKLNIKNDQKLQLMKKIILEFGHNVLNNFGLEENNEKNMCVLDRIKKYGTQTNKTSCMRPTSDKLVIPGHMWAYIKKIKAKNQLPEKKQIVQEVEKDPFNFCIGCTLLTEDLHPLFNVKLCLSCQVSFIQNYFLYDPKQGKKKFCALCGIYDSKYFPDKGNIWSFCSLCVLDIFPTSAIEDKKNWTSFLNNTLKCLKGKKKFTDSLKVNTNWWNNLSQLFMDRKMELTPLEHFSVMIHLTCGGDDNGTIDVNKFPPQGKKSSSFHLDVLSGKNMAMMFKIKKIMSCIERKSVVMLIGSPASLSQSCWFDDSTDSNASSIEFERLFMEFYNMFRKLREISSEKKLKLMWLFDCPAAIPITTQKKIKRFLNVSPLLVDTHKNIEMNRIRMIWTNIQGHETFFRSVLNI